MFVAGLVLEPLSYDLAKQLGGEVLDHCFTHHKKIHDGLTTVTVALDLEEQRVITRMGVDVVEHAQLRHVRVTHVTISKRDSSEDGASTKSKKIGPQQATLRATFTCLIDSAEKTHRNFLADNFGGTLFYTFHDEQENLFSHMAAGADGEEDDDLVDQATRPPQDDDAGDVLDEQPKKKGKRGPKLVKKDGAAGAGAEA